MRFLITGGAGFIGSAFVHNLLEGNLESIASKVIVLDKLTYAGNVENLKLADSDPRFEFVLGDICDEGVVNEISKRVDVIVNFAAESHVDKSILDSRDFFQSNVLGAAILVESAARNGVGKFIQISTDEVYGSISSGSWSESSPIEPNSPYAASKAAAEMVIRGVAKTHKLDYRITRCSNNYGLRQFPEKLIPNSILRLLRGENITIYGDGKNIREWIHVDDHCHAIDLVINHGQPQAIYNIGGDESYTNIEIAEMITDAMKLESNRIEFVADRKNHDLRYSLDDRKIRSELGFCPKLKLADSMLEIIASHSESYFINDPVKSNGS
jgi:dTDP-glucose 4,6-dehydratase